MQLHPRARRKRQHTSSKQQSQDQAQHGLKLPQLFSYSTGGGRLPANSCDSSLRSRATGLASTSSCCEGAQPSPLQPTEQGREQQLQLLELDQSQQGATQQELCATTAVRSSTAPDHPAGPHECDDVSAQKAAAQARFAEQQRLQAGGSASARVDPAILQQELARLEQQGPQARVFAPILLCNMLCCLMVLAARVSAMSVEQQDFWQDKGKGQHNRYKASALHARCLLRALLHFLRPDAVCLMCGPRPKPQPQAEHCCCDCALVCCAMQGPVREWSSGSWLQLPLLLALSGGLGWLFMSKLKPMHFANAAVEKQYAARSQYGRCLLDLWFSMAGCSGVLAAVRSDGRPPGTEPHAPSIPAATHLAALQSAVPVLLTAVLLSGVLLLLAAPKLYRRWREQLLFVGKTSIVLGTVALQPGCGGILQVGPGWLPLLGPSRAQTHAANILVAMGAVQAFLLLTLTVRVSAYIPMQLIHVSALLATVANSGASGLGMVAYALQLLTCSLWAPTCILAQLESSSRRAFLARQLPHAKKA